MTNTLKLFISTGEASADLYAAEILERLKEKAPSLNLTLQVWGMGGPHLKARGIMEIVQDSTGLGVIGVADIIKRLWFFWQLEKRLVAEIIARKPDVALLLDYPGLNMRLAEAIRKHVPHCKIVYFVAPQVWAWNQSRVTKLTALTDRLLCILPFEEAIHKATGTSTRYVGNPSAWYMANLPAASSSQVLGHFGLNPSEGPVIGIFPGSRNREITLMLPILLKAAKLLKASLPSVQFVLVRAATISAETIDRALNEHQAHGLVTVVEASSNHYVLKAVDIAWLTSGTITLESACAQTPGILGYRENPLFWLGYLAVRRLKMIGLPNIIAGEYLYPELLQENCQPSFWADLTYGWLTAPAQLTQLRAALKSKLLNLLRGDELDPFENVAEEILRLHKLSLVTAENELYMREKAVQNSQITRNRLEGAEFP